MGEITIRQPQVPRDRRGNYWREHVSPVTKLLRRGSALEHSWESARCAGEAVVAEGVAEVFPDGWKNYPAACG